MPYENQWDPNKLGPCDCGNGVEWYDDFSRVKGIDDVPQLRSRPHGPCSGTGQRPVGGWVRVWIDPPSPR